MIKSCLGQEWEHNMESDKSCVILTANKCRKAAKTDRKASKGSWKDGI